MWFPGERKRCLISHDNYVKPVLSTFLYNLQYPSASKIVQKTNKYRKTEIPFDLINYHL